MFITGPQVIKQVTGEMVTAQELGGARAQMNKSGVVQFVAADSGEGVSTLARAFATEPATLTSGPRKLRPPAATAQR